MITTAADYGYQARLLEATLAINNDQRHLVVERLLRHLKNLAGRPHRPAGPVLQAGDGRRARFPRPGHRHPGHRVRRLRVRLRPGGQSPPGGACPCASRADAYAAAEGADAVVVATEWPQFLDLDFSRLRAATKGELLFDGRNCLSPTIVSSAGFVYEGVGRRVPGRPAS